MKPLTRLFGILSIFLCFGGLAIASPQAVVQVVDPFNGVWLRDEDPDLFVRVVNIGDTPFLIDVYNDVVFEQEGQTDQPEPNTPEYWHEYGLGRGDPFARVSATKGEGGIEIPPGHAFAMNELDFERGFAHFLSWPELMPVRAHVRIGEDEWISSDWVDRRIVQWPDFEALEPLFQYGIPQSDSLRNVYQIPVGEDQWLVVAIPGHDFFMFRICKVPAEVEPINFSYDEELRRLYVEFSGDEEDVVWISRFGMPISGSERTVPHLHKWLAFSGRPYRDSDPDEYPRVIRIPDEELAALKASARANQRETAQSRQAGRDPGGTDEPKQWNGSMSLWLAIVIGVALLSGVGVAVARFSKRRAKGIM